jgi:hypothetical protein
MFEPPVHSVLVAALDADLRHSLAFVLVAEGFSVESCATWPPDYQPRAEVVVVDEGALPRLFRGDEHLGALGNRLVLLTNKTELKRRLPSATIIGKPLLDRALIEAVQTALERDPKSVTHFLDKSRDQTKI